MPTVSVYSGRQSGINCGQQNTPHKRQSPCVRSFFIVRMLTLNRRFVKVFRDCSEFRYIPDHFHRNRYVRANVNDCPAVDKEKGSQDVTAFRMLFVIGEYLRCNNQCPFIK